MNFIALTIFPEMFNPFWEHGIIRRAIDRNKIRVSAIDIRNFANGKHRVTDNRPYGGGCGMVMKPEPLAAAIRAATKKAPLSKKILLTPPRGDALIRVWRMNCRHRMDLFSSAVVTKVSMNEFVLISSMMKFPSVIMSLPEASWLPW